jgi:hypothetical protein
MNYNNNILKIEILLFKPVKNSNGTFEFFMGHIPVAI